MTQIDRYLLKLTNLEKALTRLGEALNLPESDTTRDVVIKRFELSIE